MILPVVAESYVVRRDSERLWLTCAVRCGVVWCGAVLTELLRWVRAVL